MRLFTFGGSTIKRSASQRGTLLFSLSLLVTLLCGSTMSWAQNVSATWGNNNSVAWYTGGNWVGGSYAGSQGAAAANTNIATFNSGQTGNPIGINMGTNSLNLGAIFVDSRATPLNIANSSPTGGILRLYGATLNAVPNTIIRHTGTGLLTLQSTANTLGVGLGNSTENIIDNAGPITINSIISNVAPTAKLTKTGSGLLLLTAQNTYTGLTTVSGGTMQLNRTGGGTLPATNDVTVANGGTLLISTAQTLNNITVDAGGTLIVAATLTVTGTATINGTFQVNQGGNSSGGTWNYGPSSTLRFNNTSAYGPINATNSFWPASNSPVNVTVAGSGSGTINLAVSRTVAGTFTTSNGVSLSGVGDLIINGTLQINTGGYFLNSPTYGPSSTLKYNTGGTYGRASEWLGNSGPGYPANVQVSNNTTLNLANGSPAQVTQLSGSLTIDAGSTVSSNITPMTVPLTVLGNVNLAGALTLSSANGGDLQVGGNWTVTGAGALNDNSRTVLFNGASGNQTISKTGGQAFSNFVVDKAAGNVVLANDLTVTQSLSLNNGVISTGANKVIVSAGATVSRTNGHVAGYLQKNIATGSPTVTFEIGGLTNYRPVTLAFNNVTSAGVVTASVSQTAGAHPQLGTSAINPTLRLDRYFTLSNSGTAFTSYDATFNYVAADVVNGANPLSFIAGNFDGAAWTYPTVGTKTTTSTQVTGLTTFNDFAFGESNTTAGLSAGTLNGFGNVCINTTARPNTFTITGFNLSTAPVTVSSLTGFTFSTDNVSYTPSLSIAQPGGNFSQQVFVKFTPTAVQVYDGNIDVSGGGASTISVTATGSGVNTTPTATAGTVTSITSVSATVAGNITATGCSAITAYGIEYSTTNGFADGTGTQAPASNLSGGSYSVDLAGLSPTTVYYFKAYATNNGGTSYSSQSSFTTATPTLAASPLSAFGQVCPGATVAPNSFTITGTNLLATDVTVAALNGYTYSTDNITYTASLSLSQPGGSYSQLIWVKFSPVAAQSYDGTITVGGGGAQSISVAASGSAVSTPPTVSTVSATSVSQVAATLNGSILAEGCTAVTAYGFEYSTTNGFANGTGTNVPASNLASGSFSANTGTLAPNTTYYFKAYATNNGGTSYGSQLSFTTSGLLAPAAIAATDIAANSFTANWHPVTGASSYALDVSTSSTFTGSGTLVSEAFENTLTLFTAGGTGGFFSGNSASGDRPATSPFFVAGTSGYGISNGTATLTSSNINTTGGAAQFSFRLASFSIGSTGNGADAGDIVNVEVSPNGGTSYFSTVRVLGNTNAYWAYDATGVASAAYDGNATPVDFSPAGGAARTTDGYSTITVTGLPSATNVRIRISMVNNSANERWVIDNLNVTGTTASFVPGYNNLPVSDTTQSVTGLTPNTTYYYRVRAVSANSTSANSNTITAQTCQAALLSSTHTNITCNGAANGTIDLTITGGTAPISISWAGPNGFTATTEDLTGLAAGTYTVTVLSNTGCPATASIEITEPAALSAAISGTQTVCEGSSSDITVTISGGTAPYSVTYNDGNTNTTVGSLVAGANTIPVTPAVGAHTYTLVSVTDNGSCTGTVSGTASVTVNPNYTITASAGANGTISPVGVTTLSCDGTGDQTYTITPSACYAIADVIVDGSSVGAVGSYTFTDVMANHTISASFIQTTYTITVTPGTNGSITPATGSVNCGDDATFTITADACYAITDVIVDGNSVGAVGTYTFNDVNANHTISATFAQISYNIDVTAGNNGFITPASGTVNCGDNATYTITPDPCYSISDVIVDGISVGAVGTYTFNNVNANHTISATFSLNTYSITVNAGANGAITPGTGSVNCGDNATFAITANACYVIGDVIVDGVSQGAIASYTFNNVNANHTISATFVQITYTITATAGANGTITPGTGSVNCGENAAYAITPAACYSVADVVVDGVSQGAITTYTFNNVTSNHTISATFVANSPLTTPVVTGPTNVCQYIGTGEQVVFTASSTGATGYTWVVPPTNVTVVSGQGTSTLTVTFGSGFTAQANKQIKVTGTSSCGNSTQTIYYLLAQGPNTPQPISGPTNVCPIIGTANTFTYTIPAVVGATSYIWTAQAGTTVVTNNGTSADISFSNGFTTSAITVRAVNGCGTSTVRSLTVSKVNPSTPGLISGPTNVCANMAPGGTAATYSILPVSGATTYTWTVPGGISFSGQGTTSISFTYPAGFTIGSISVTAGNGCGTSNARTLSVTRLTPATPGIIDVIEASPCPNRVYTYTIASMPANATSVQWTVPAAATGFTGQGTTSITVTYPATAVAGAVTAQGISNCGSSTIRSTEVKLPACPPVEPGFSKFTPATTMVAAETLAVNVYPNPTTNEFRVQVNSSNREKVQVRILDAQGRAFKTLTLMPYQTISVGSELKAGAYILETTQGNEVKTMKLLKF